MSPTDVLTNPCKETLMYATKINLQPNSFFLYMVVVVVVAFFLACVDFGRMFDHSFPANSFFFS